MKYSLLFFILFVPVFLQAQVVLPAYQGVHHPGFACGQDSISDYDGNKYATVKIGNQCWMAENLKYLPSVVGPDIGSNTTPYYYVYGYNGTDVTAAKATENYDTYGVLYNWTAAMDSSSSISSTPSGAQGVCPDGWHLPSISEWSELTDFLGGSSVAGGKMKEAGTTHWVPPNVSADNSSGFTALGAGRRETNGSFSQYQEYAYFWATDEGVSTQAFNTYVYSYHQVAVQVSDMKTRGFLFCALHDPDLEFHI